MLFLSLDPEIAAPNLNIAQAHNKPKSKAGRGFPDSLYIHTMLAST
jgi:hypothetical protein